MSSICPASPRPVIDGGAIVGLFSLSQLGLVLSAVFLMVSLIVSVVHLLLHATHFSNKLEQARLMRIIFTIPVFALVSFVTILLGKNGIYVPPWLDAWESVALANYFLLLCAYIAPDEQGQVAYFTSGKKNYRLFRWTWILVFQWIPVSFVAAIVEDTTLSTGNYCVTTFGPRFAKPYLMLIKIISITLAIVALIRLAERLRPALRERHLRTQLWTFKSLIVLNTLLQFTFQIIAYNVNPTDAVPLVDLAYTLPMLVLSITTAFYSVAFLFAFSWRPYMLTERSRRGSDGIVRRYVGGPGGVTAIAHALNPLDVLQSLFRATQLLFNRRMPELMTPKYLSMSEASTGIRSIGSPQSLQGPQKPQKQPEPQPQPLPQPSRQTSSIPSHPSAAVVGRVGSTGSPRQVPVSRRPELEKSLPPDPRSPFDDWSLYDASLYGDNTTYVPVRFSVSETPDPTRRCSLPRGIANQPLPELGSPLPLPELGERSPLPELEVPAPAVRSVPVRSVPVHHPEYTHCEPETEPGNQIHDVIDEYRMTMYQRNRF